jgi:hypothetical protein
MIEFSFSPPFFRRMPEQSLYFSERLRLITYFGKSGRPKKHRIELIWKQRACMETVVGTSVFPPLIKNSKIFSSKGTQESYFGDLMIGHGRMKEPHFLFRVIPIFTFDRMKLRR